MKLSELIYIFILFDATAVYTGTIQTIGTINSQLAIKGTSVRLACYISQFGSQDVVNIYKSDSSVLTGSLPDPSETTCVPSLCLTTVYGRYTYSADSGHVYIDITNLNRAEDQKWWTCVHGNQRKDVYLTIYTVPQTLQLDSPPTEDQDLAENVVTLRCNTGCTYPQPSFKWFYTEFGGSHQEWSAPGSDTDTTGGCTDSEKIYTSTLSLAKYSTFPGNLNKTVKFTCGIPTFTGMTQPLFTNPSVNIQFAVQVTSVTLKDGNSEAAPSIKVTNGVPKTLTCATSVSRPRATIIWFLSGKEQTRSNSSSIFTFTPNNNDQNKQLFCKAFNIQNENQAVSSHEATLYVQATLANPCLENPCVRGTCFSHDSLFLCQCPKGYTGKLCENQVDPCEPNPCQHGTCFSHGLLFLCQCVNGYYGKTCEKTVEPCRSNPCIHGTCFSRVSEFLCKCQPGYTGERCDKIGDQSPSIVG